MSKNQKKMAVSISEAAILFGVTPDVVRKAIKNKVIKSFKISPRKTLISIQEVARILRVSEGDIHYKG